MTDVDQHHEDTAASTVAALLGVPSPDGALPITGLVTDPLLDIPSWLRRALPPEERDRAWADYIAEHPEFTLRAPAPAVFKAPEIFPPLPNGMKGDNLTPRDREVIAMLADVHTEVKRAKTTERLAKAGFIAEGEAPTAAAPPKRTIRRNRRRALPGAVTSRRRK